MNSRLLNVLIRVRCSALRNSGCTPFLILFLLSALALWTPRACKANEICPWLNDATAAGFLGGTVTSTVTHPSTDKNDANCEFIHRDGAVVTTLQIEVKTMSTPTTQFASHLAACGTHSEPVKAIGNEAVACGQDQKKGKYSESIVGRVRDRAFIVRINSMGDESDRDTTAVRARKIAEQVAGFLF
jgi:hypothetical protein